MPAIRPPRLEPGDVLGIVAPSNQVVTRRAELELGCERLERLGYRVRPGRNLWRQHGTAAGTVAERLEDVHTLWADPKIKGLVAATGGYSAITLVDRLDYDLIRRNPKVFVGMSDISLLLNAVWARTGLVTFHGSCLAEGLGADDYRLEGPLFQEVLGHGQWPGPSRMVWEVSTCRSSRSRASATWFPT